MTVQNEVTLSDLRCLCDPSIFNFETTADIEPAGPGNRPGTGRPGDHLRPGNEKRRVSYLRHRPGRHRQNHHCAADHPQSRQTPCPHRRTGAWSTTSRMNIARVPCRCNPAMGLDSSRVSTGWSADFRIRLPKEFQADPFREKIVDIQKRYGRAKERPFRRIGPVGTGKAPQGGKNPLRLSDHPHERGRCPVHAGGVRKTHRAAEQDGY
jgi:hypothetical protein